MADNFEFSDAELFAQSEMPELSVPEEPFAVSAQAEQAPQSAPADRPVRRRRKRRRRPKWQRLLWKYWPPIRFGLIILAGILLIWLLFSCVAESFSGGETEPNETDGSSSTSDPTDGTTEPSTASTTEPSVPETTEPTIPPVPDPYAGAVPDSWYENTLFIGDFSVVGLSEYGRAGNADYFCSSGMGVYNYDEQSLSDTNFEEQDLATLLASKTYDKIIINLGINNCGYPTSSLINAYTEMVNTIQTAQPNAKLILHGIMVVTEEYAERADYFSKSHIDSVNEQIEALADGVNVFYINLNSSFADSSGYLTASISTDGCHLTGTGYADWAKLISVELGKLGIE